MRAILLSCFGGVLAVISVQGDKGSAARTPWGLVADPVAPLVVSTCGSCHSPYLITHHHRDRDAWEKTLLKMQKNGMKALPDSFQAKVLDYLVLYQGPLKEDRPPESPWAQAAFHANPLWD
tara:strand:- start:406 stop:768 length:363 start_codon:yes stop_codon:yes gene_type:complete